LCPPTITAGSVFQEKLGTTTAGLPRQRRKWTDEINKFLLRCYLRTTKLEKELIGYRQRIHQLFKTKYPDWQNITEQRLTDQLRTIRRNNLIPETIINEIKEEVRIEQRNVAEEEEVDINPENENITNSFENRADQSNIEQNLELTNSNIIEQNPKIKSIHDRYIEMQIKYGKLQAKSRPPLPKVNNSIK
jgi:signal transduction histidine kinase